MKTLWTIVSLLVALNIGGEVMGSGHKSHHNNRAWFKEFQAEKNYKELAANLNTMRCMCIKALQHNYSTKKRNKARDEARSEIPKRLGFHGKTLPSSCEKVGLLGKSFDKDLHGSWENQGYELKIEIYGNCVSLSSHKE